MTVLVTGGAGYIGSHMVLELLDSGESVVVLDNLSTGFRWAVPTNATLVVGDVGDQELLRSIVRKHGVKAIIHFAGSIVVPESVADPLGYYHNNTVKSRALMEVAVEMGIEQFIFSSTAAVYGEPEAVPITEDAALVPVNPYGRTKLAMELALADVADATGLAAVALRYFNAASPSGERGEDHDPETHLIPLVLQVALGQQDTVTIFGDDYPTRDGTCVRDYVHVTDLAQAHILALRALGEGSRTYNL
ncbi:MAG: UDP-glucose 4-epimerase GalE, partial [Hyphomicrobiaceae bacterium]|nr:UDP-glucose 4-epimerase GalE [Hyphomicrobiaceae bacterium]